jgi:hypothetical protein
MFLKDQLWKQSEETAYWHALPQAAMFNGFLNLRRKEYQALLFWSDRLFLQLELLLSNQNDFRKILSWENVPKNQYRLVQDFLSGYKHFSAEPPYLSLSRAQGTQGRHMSYSGISLAPGFKGDYDSLRFQRMEVLAEGFRGDCNNPAGERINEQRGHQ